MQNDTYMPTLESKHLILRKLSEADAVDMFEYASDPDVSLHTTWEPHKSIQDSFDFIHMILEKYEKNELTDWGIIDKVSGKFIGTSGFVYVHPTHSRAEIGYALSKKYWGKGLMTEAVQEIIRYGFNVLGLNRIEARAEIQNIGSWRVMENVNMHFEGILREHLFAKGAYHDVKMYAILKSDYERKRSV